MFAPDLRNHGRSFHSDTLDYSDLAKDILDFLDEHSLEKAIMTGHSMGGKTAMELALEYPNRIKALIVEDMVPGATSPQFSKHLDALLRIDPSKIRSRRDVEMKLTAAVGNRMIVLFLLKNLHRDSEGGFTWRANIPAIAKNYNSIWCGLKTGRLWNGPALFIRGERSQTVADERFEEIIDSFPQAKIVTVAGAGHWVHADSMEGFLAEIEDFLSSLSY